MFNLPTIQCNKELKYCFCHLSLKNEWLVNSRTSIPTLSPSLLHLGLSCPRCWACSHSITFTLLIGHEGHLWDASSCQTHTLLRNSKNTEETRTLSVYEVFCFFFFLFVDRICPYYLSRNLKQEADIIFMPYNYLVDPKVNQQKWGILFMKGHCCERCFY